MWQMLSVKDSLLLKIKKQEIFGPVKSSKNHSHIVWQVCDTACLLFWRLFACNLSFDSLKSSILKKCFSNLNLYKAVKSSG